MKNELIITCGILALATASTYANPNLLNSSWDAIGTTSEGTDQQFITDTPGALYDLSFNISDIFGDAPPTVYAFWSYNTLAVKLDATFLFNGEANFTFTDDGLVGSGDDELFLNIEDNGSPNPAGATFSDFSLVEETPGVPDTATTSSLLGLGLLGLAALRRKLQA